VILNGLIGKEAGGVKRIRKFTVVQKLR